MPRQDTAPRWLLAIVIAVHGTALLGLAEPDLPPTSPPRPLEVALLAPPTPEPALAPAPQPPRQQQKPPAKPRPAPSRLPTPALSEAITVPEASAPEVWIRSAIYRRRGPDRSIIRSVDTW